MTPTEITRRSAIGLAGASAAALVMFGPRARDDVPPGRVVIDYWDKWTGAEGRVMRRLVDEFNQTQARIFVRYLAVSAIDQKAMVAIAGGSPPDVVGLWSFNVPAFADAGAIVPLDELAAAHGLMPERCVAAVRPLLLRGGQQWAMITTCGSLALYLNLEALEAAGLSPDDAPATLSELDDLNDRVVSVSRQGEIERAGFIHTEPGWWSWLWGYHFGGRLLDSSGRSSATDPRNVAAYDWVRSYPERFGLRQLLSFQAGNGFYGTAQNAFLTGRVAAVLQGPWMANLIESFAPGMRYRAVPMPVSEDMYQSDAPVGLFEGDVLAIPKGAPNPEASFAFIAWLQDRQRLETLALDHRKCSPLEEVSPDFYDRHPNPSIRTHRAIASSPRVFHVPRTRAWPKYEAEFNAAFESLWLGDLTADQMLGRIEIAMESELDRLRGRSDERPNS